MFCLFRRKMFYIKNYFQRNLFSEKKRKKKDFSQKIFRPLAHMENELRRKMNSDFKQPSVVIQRFGKEKLKLEK